MKIYVGNLSYSVTDEDLIDAFSEFGDVTSAKVTMDPETGESKGFGFVEMPVTSEGRDAVQVLNESPLCGRLIRVNEARGGGSGGSGSGGGGGGGNSNNGRGRRPRRSGGKQGGQRGNKATSGGNAPTAAE
ncbi:RNA recognition motif domain-containing protein [Aestuariirhabdus litorea]|uniref:RNA-binding protein n=1 Tax=Aestuariirhabdus litorea TaxID=2528527 RepID=A0A3P3VQE0_9GAMM|nr:RNA-binding protein [Aestuariirhabdus litorea]RRJ83033.1 RNA-binding protein [Aestuariirhabdus litorea]RWW93191.1 RNA-binding protein [Endozoicomonadaceae bacterium GTF-13]